MVMTPFQSKRLKEQFPRPLRDYLFDREDALAGFKKHFPNKPKSALCPECLKRFKIDGLGLLILYPLKKDTDPFHLMGYKIVYRTKSIGLYPNFLTCHSPVDRYGLKWICLPDADALDTFRRALKLFLEKNAFPVPDTIPLQDFILEHGEEFNKYLRMVALFG